MDTTTILSYDFHKNQNWKTAPQVSYPTCASKDITYLKNEKTTYRIG